MGIPAEMLPHIFDMFAKADRSLEKAQDGLGIGLTIAKKIVELHGGDLVAYSDGVGTGSRFVVKLPVALEEARRPGPRVLVVDDNKDFASSMQIMLGMMGSETQTAQDGVEALKIAATFRPEVVFLDIGLPKLNGYDVCRVIREQAWGKDVTIVALTGWGQNEDFARSQEAGFNHHLVKPVDNSALEKIMQDAGQALTA
jgi:CheY-like chemotaxis protein